MSGRGGVPRAGVTYCRQQSVSKPRRRRPRAAARPADRGLIRRHAVQAPGIAPAALALAVLAAVAVTLLRPVHGVDPGARVALETAILLCAIPVAGLLVGNFDRNRQLPEVLLLVGLLAVSLSGFMYWAVPALAGLRHLRAGEAGQLTCELIAAAAIAAAACAPRRTIEVPRRALIAAAAGLVAGASVLGVALTRTDLAAGHSVVVGVQGAAAAILVVAACGFLFGAWRSEPGRGLLAGASVLLAGTTLQPLRLPAVATTWITPGEGLRLAAAVLLLASAYVRYVRLRGREASAAICAERERIASDLHDGLAQDLACIAAQGQRLDCRLDADHPLMLASRQALGRVRGVIVDLTASTAPTVEAALRLVADEVGQRLGLQVDLRIADDAAPGLEGCRELADRDRLIRTVRNAIVNAAQPSSARHIDVLVARNGAVVTRVPDPPKGDSVPPAPFSL
jgi:signal transduction histidine kinase